MHFITQGPNGQPSHPFVNYPPNYNNNYSNRPPHHHHEVVDKQQHSSYPYNALPHHHAHYERYPAPAAYGYVSPPPHSPTTTSHTPSPPPQQQSTKNNNNNKKATTEGGIKKKRKTKKNKIIIPMRDMIRLFSMPQPVAAKKLNVSISTLKRRFYELDITRWPSNHTLQEFNLGEMNPLAMQSVYHRTGATADLILSASALKQSASYYSLYKEASGEEKKQVGTLLNLYNTSDAKHIDPMTAVILREAFLENTDAIPSASTSSNESVSSSDDEQQSAKKNSRR
jgi:hypothetical protein